MKIYHNIKTYNLDIDLFSLSLRHLLLSVKERFPLFLLTSITFIFSCVFLFIVIISWSEPEHTKSSLFLMMTGTLFLFCAKGLLDYIGYENVDYVNQEITKVKQNNGNSPVMNYLLDIVIHNKEDIEKFASFVTLYRQSGNLNQQNDDGNTLLHLLAEHFPVSSSIIEIMVLGGDIHILNNQNKTAFSLISPELYPTIAAIEKMNIKGINPEISGDEGQKQSFNRL